MSLDHIKNLVKRAHREKYGIGAFNTQNLEITLGIARGAMLTRAPIIIQVSESTIEYAGIKPITHIVSTIAKNLPVDIPIALHLDHGKKFQSVVECIEAGFSSIMMDASDLPFDENVALTKKAVEYAHKRGVWAQGELGRLKGIEDIVKVKEREAFMTNPAEALEFVKKTGVDTLAISIGNIHGIVKFKKGVPKLDLKRLKEISERVKIPLVLHGASGIKKEEIQKAVRLGINVINIDTEIRLAFANSLRNVLRKDKEIYDPRKILAPTIDAVAKVVAEKIKMFGSAGKA